jgi:hypothetical protein
MQQENQPNHGVLTMILPLEALLAVRDGQHETAERLLRESQDLIASENLVRNADGSLAGPSLLRNDYFKHNPIICELLRREAFKLLKARSRSKKLEPGKS